MSRLTPYGIEKVGLLAIGATFLVAAWVGFLPQAYGKSAGWRFDGSGVFPGQDVPGTTDSGSSIRWMTALPAPSNGSPVVVKNRIYVVSEPTVLMALNPGTGKILWQRENNYIDTLKGEARAKAEKEKIATEALGENLDIRKKELYRMKRRLRGKAPEPGLYEATKALENQVNDMRKELDKRWRLRPLQPIESIGYSSGTPVVDETGVYVGFGNGVFSSFDPDGNRRWSVGFGTPPPKMRGYPRGHSASPVVVGDQLVVGYQKLRVLNKRTGAVNWEGDIFLDYGTPVPFSVGGENFVATAQGEIYRMKDGLLVASGLGDAWHNSPVVQGNTLYYVGSGVGRTGGTGTEAETSQDPSHVWAIRVGVKDGSFFYERIWKEPVEEVDYYASPVIYEGIVYAVSMTGVLRAIDARTGKTLYQRELPSQGRVFASLAIADEHLFVFGPTGKVWVFEVGAQENLVAEWVVGASLNYRIWSSPFFADDSIFIREREHLYCFGAP